MQYLDGAGSQKPMQEFAPCIRKSKAKAKPTPKIPYFVYKGKWACFLVNWHIQCYLG